MFIGIPLYLTLLLSSSILVQGLDQCEVDLLELEDKNMEEEESIDTKEFWQLDVHMLEKMNTERRSSVEQLKRFFFIGKTNPLFFDILTPPPQNWI